jgi:phosphoribosyl-dephospho-CoA transferase
MMTPPRHSLVWLTPEGWRCAQRRDAACAQTLETWARAGWPLVARRHDPDAARDEVCLGLPLPDRGRVALRLPAASVARVGAALPLGAICAAAPAPWQEPLAQLAAEADAEGIVLRAYGSAAWQALTGIAYVGDASDIDLLFAPDSAEQLRRGLGLLARHAQRLPLDGEILFPSGRAAAWKEWLLADTGRAGMRVLVKHSGGVALETTRELIGELAPEPLQ